MSLILVLIVTLIGLVQNSVAVITQDGQCQNVLLQQDFKVERFLGKWYEMDRTDNPYQTGDCSYIELASTTDNNIEFTFSAVHENSYHSQRGTASMDNRPVITLEGSFLPEPIEIQVMQTDYDNYAIVFNCINLSTTQRGLSIWVLARDRTQTDSTRSDVTRTLILEALGVDISTYKTIDHSEAACTILPLNDSKEPVILPGQCNLNISVVPNLDMPKYMGRWHENFAYVSDHSQNRCSQTRYSQDENGVISVTNSQVLEQTLATTSGTLILSPDGSGKLTVQLNLGSVVRSHDLWVLETDYDSYSVAYACVNLENNQRRVYSWILSRSRRLTAEARAAVNVVVEREPDLSFDFYRQTDQSDQACFFNPDLVRGQCDQNIPVEENFNATAYSGIWHDIESYPSMFQTGTCRNGEFGVVNDEITVLNTQVIDRSLHTVNGVAAVASNDGSAKLIFNTTIVGTDVTISADYWVLDTDYVSYSLVYTCANVNAQESRVRAWKMSRTKQLTSAASTAMSNVIRNITAIEENFFQPVDQSDDACFYLPELDREEPVIFPGQCDENISVFQNISIERFMGRWHENYAYKSDHSQNLCSHTTYSLDENNVISVTNNQVLEQTLASTSGTVIRAPDGSGRWTVQLNLSSGVRTHDLWILDTDYDSYAVAYACVNLENNRRRVYSWILSRTRQLTAEAKAAADEVVDRELVLSYQYYRQTDQSAQTCFFNPDLVRGQCDENIPVEQNFNATAYSGIWHDIESYPSMFQTGTCRNGELNEFNDELTVLNTQVIDRSLQTVNGVAAVASNDGSAKLIFNTTFDGLNMTVSADYWILDTDYVSYSLVYTCANVNAEESRVRAWKMSRTKQLTSAASTAMSNVIRNTPALEERFFQPVDQSDDACFYFPKLDREDPVIFPGHCDENISVFQNISIERFMGRWHENYAYKSDHSQNLCSHTTYSLDENNVISVTNNQVLEQTLASTSGTVIRAPDGSGRWTVQLNLSSGVRTHDLWILDTDYDSYAVAYACVNLENNRRRVYSWILSRTRQLTAEAKAAADEVVDRELVLSYQYYRQTDQSAQACFFNPDLVRGQCDESIPVEQNFNATAYSGIWHDIESYPSMFQTGTCRNGELNEFNDELTVLNTQVIDRSLQTVNGVAAVASNDGSAKLIFNTTIDGLNMTISADYWILDTDYVSYSLVYTCANVNAEESRVRAWKMSRTKQLTSAASTAMSNVIRNTSALEERFFQPVDQSDDACFYFPKLDREDPVIFPGQCDENISVFQNISIERFMGRWHENYAYKSDHSQNLCSHTTYSLDENNVISVTNNQVLEQTLASTAGTVIRAPDGSGRWTVQLNLSSGVRTHDLWILDTDYDSYAVAYACVNLENNRRRVYSWILSRTRQLTAEAKAAADKVVDREMILSYQYYRQTDQSNQACFFNPDLVSGLCNQNIPVKANFNSTAYMGVWHDIESYPSVLQTGTCRNAEYSLVDGDIAILNSEVVNQALQSVASTAVLASNDGSAKFEVRFPIEGTDTIITADYWILDTDYNSYSLVYTCANINENESRVSAWKLSRTKQLTREASAAIDNVVRNVSSIEDRFFQPVDQSDDSCFYFPEHQPGVPVVFFGQCDDTVPVEQDFDLQRFVGTWYDYESYPIGVSRRCASYQLDASSGNVLNIQFSQIVNDTLNFYNGTLRAETNESAKMTLNMRYNGEDISLPIWIIGTDYEQYALAYSCQNVNASYRAVYSWKIGKSEFGLDSSSLYQITRLMERVDILDQRYYDRIYSNDDDACFHLPDIPAGEPVILPGRCDWSMSAVSPFRAEMYMGRWRLIESYFSSFQSGQCNQASYTISSDLNLISIENSQVSNQTLATATGSAPTNFVDGKLQVTMDSTLRTVDYWVLATDYTSYALVYSCSDVNTNERRVLSWKLSRTDSFTPEAVNDMDSVINSINVLNNRYYTAVDQSDEACFYFPDPNPSTPVEFRGQCDENIEVFQNFDVSRYTGRWYDIESFPMAFQNGRCPSAEYTLNNASGVNVYNTEVVNQQLSTINGTAVVTSTDGSAKLAVTFPIGGMDRTTPYWVLDTDYANYALVYSCTNINDESFRVSSWKLSRNRTLSAQSAADISAAMDKVQVLRQDYYNVRGHSDEDCFSYPDNFDGPVILEGQCEAANQVDAVTNFNPANFSGTWVQVASFPSELQNGACTSNEYTYTTNGFDILRTSVYNEKLQTLSGKAVTSNDGRGVLEVSYNENGVIFNQNVFILDIDYEEFALLYGCRNIDNNRKQVYSWKYSRTSSLSAAANERIDAIVSSRDDLFEGYYGNDAQDNTACFYYPVFDTPQTSIVLPGPCDPTIRPIANFNVSRYLGRWYEVERYPHFRQGAGRCNRATYTNGTDNSFDLINAHVLNGGYSSIAMSAVAAADGSGYLVITINRPNGVGRAAPLNILATDYTDYALLYACTDLSNNRRQVGSWKFSRTPTLSSAGNTAINTTIANTQGLYQDYYNPTGQSEQDCVGTITGRCENITGMQGFDLNRYLGWWHEIERYPLASNAGECRSTQYQSEQNQIRFVDTSVYNLTGQLTTGTVVAGQNGKLTRTLSNGQQEDLWILATDYNSYSLVVTCETVDDTNIRVWSAKYSKSRELSQEADSALASVVATNNMLFAAFYNKVDQSDGTCFHYPEQDGLEVILPGLCDESIPTMRDFDITAYTGTWYQMERYPYPDVPAEASCIGTRYTLDEASNTVAVHNWQVLGDDLQEIEGTATLSSDGSGKLKVELPASEGNGTTSADLYILSTDYENYSLAYTCRNINAFQRSVVAFKLSRTRTMPSAGAAAINAIISQREELHQPFFIPVTQREDCKEPNSSYFVKSSIILILFCYVLQTTFI